MGLQLSWLERCPDKTEVPDSSSGKPTMSVIKENLYFKNAYLDGKGGLIGYNRIKGVIGSPDALLKADKREKSHRKRPPSKVHHPLLPIIRGV